MADNKVNSGLLEFSEDQKVFVALDAETSEVKKAVTIDGDGVETDMLGVQPTGKKEITSTAEVNVASYATAQVVDEDLVAGNIKKDVDILGVVGSYEPEAPASDFSTAVVTIDTTNLETSDQNPFFLPLPIIYEDELTSYVEMGSMLTTTETTVNVPLYNNKFIMSYETLGLSYFPLNSVQGSAVVEDGVLTITSNCTLIFRDSQ